MPAQDTIFEPSQPISSYIATHSSLFTCFFIVHFVSLYHGHDEANLNCEVIDGSRALVRILKEWLPDLDSHQDKRINRPPCYFHTTWQQELIGAAGRTPTRIVPIRSRMPHMFGHGSVLKWSERQDFHLRPPGPRPGALKTELRSDETGGSEGTRTLSLPADNGLLRVFELRIRKWPAKP